LHCIKVYFYIAYHLESPTLRVALSASEMYNLYGTLIYRQDMTDSRRDGHSSLSANCRSKLGLARVY